MLEFIPVDFKQSKPNAYSPVLEKDLNLENFGMDWHLQELFNLAMNYFNLKATLKPIGLNPRKVIRKGLLT